MEVIARSSFVRTSPRKLALVANAVRGLTPQAAVNQLKLMPKKSGRGNIERVPTGNRKCQE